MMPELETYRPSDITAVVIDMQENWVGKDKDDRRREDYPSKLVPAQQKTLKQLQKHQIPIVVVELWRNGEEGLYTPYGPTIKELTDIIGDQKPVKKTRNSALTKHDDYPLLSHIQDRNYLLVMGIHASACVGTTAKNAADFGFTILTAGPLIADNRRNFLNNGTTIKAHGTEFDSEMGKVFYEEKNYVHFFTTTEKLLESIIP